MIYTRREAADYFHLHWHLRVTEGSLATMATRGGGPVYFKQGRYIYYRKMDLDEWAGRRRTGLLDSTSTPPEGNGGYPFSLGEDNGDLPDEFDHRNTGDARFDEITKLLEDAGIY